ncbi:MAG: zinc ribbon domain-containing protein [Candidatus Binataceae bacterium]
MPIYEYQCPTCGVFEVTRRITEAPLKRCPTCKSKVERLLSRSSFVLKGSGWYATDYARSGSKASDTSASSESAVNGKPASDSSAKGESAKSESSKGEPSSKPSDSKPSKSSASGKSSATSSD